MDMEEGVVNELLRGPLGEVFDHQQLITDVSGSGNNWCRLRHTVTACMYMCAHAHTHTHSTHTQHTHTQHTHTAHTHTQHTHTACSLTLFTHTSLTHHITLTVFHHCAGQPVIRCMVTCTKTRLWKQCASLQSTATVSSLSSFSTPWEEVRNNQSH